MEIGAARDQIVRCLQRTTLPFTQGHTVLRDTLHDALDELRLLAEHLPIEHPKPAAAPEPAPVPVPENPPPAVPGNEIGLGTVDGQPPAPGAAGVVSGPGDRADMMSTLPIDPGYGPAPGTDTNTLYQNPAPLGGAQQALPGDWATKRPTD